MKWLPYERASKHWYEKDERQLNVRQQINKLSESRTLSTSCKHIKLWKKKVMDRKVYLNVNWENDGQYNFRSYSMGWIKKVLIHSLYDFLGLNKIKQKNSIIKSSSWNTYFAFIFSILLTTRRGLTLLITSWFTEMPSRYCFSCILMWWFWWDNVCFSISSDNFSSRTLL